MIVTSKDIYHLPFSVTASLTFANSQTVNIDSEDIDASGTGWSVDAGTSTLPIGAVVGRSFTLSLINDQGQWNNYDFFGCTIDLTLDYGDGCTVTVKDLTVTEPPSTLGTVITMTALDNAWRLDKPYTTALAYPASIRAVYQEICSNCGIGSKTTTHDIFNRSISTAFDTSLTCRQVLGEIAAAAAANIRISADGKLEIVDIKVPTATSKAGAVDIDEWISLTQALHDVTITGVQTRTEDDQAVLVGSEGYVIEIDDSVILAGQEQAILTSIYSKIGGLTLRKFSGSAYNYPVVELFDPIVVTDITGTEYYSMVGSVNWKLGGGTDIACEIDTPMSVGSSFDPSAKALIAARKLIAQERTAREQAVMDLQEALEAAGGLYETTESAPGGGTIYYLHDKETLAESTNVIKLTSEALGLSTDGGETYPVGIAINGDVIARILSAEGINADWITTGALVVRDQAKGNVLFSADVAAGVVHIEGISVNDGVVYVGPSKGAHVEIDENGMEIIRYGRVLANFGADDALLPATTKIGLNGKLRIGDWEFEPRMDGGFTLSFAETY